MSVMTLPVGSLLYFDTGTDVNTPTWTKLSEHNRASVSVDVNRFEKTQRMANGSLRKVWIADKKQLSTNWNTIPTNNQMTVDGGMGASEMQSFYLNKGKGTFKVKISYNGVSARDEIILMCFSSYSSSLIKRNVKSSSADVPQEFWDVSIGLEEV